MKQTRARGGKLDARPQLNPVLDRRIGGVGLKRLVGTYAVSVLAIFVFGYVVLGIRELGLYFFLLILNLPISVALLPVSEHVSATLGIGAGSTVHVLGVQVVSLAFNAVLLWGAARVFNRWLAKPIQPSGPR